MFVGDEIRKRRLARGYSQIRLAGRVGLNPVTIQKAELGGLVTRRTAELLAEALECQPEELLPKSKRRG
jgi:transcriptional regulator with XRE-family HTH domain